MTHNKDCCIDSFKIKKILKEKNLHTDDIAKMIRVSKTVAWRLANTHDGSISYGVCTIVRLSIALNVHINEFLFDDCLTPAKMDC